MFEAVNANAALYFVDRHCAEGRGDKVAYIRRAFVRTTSAT
jgi:hypothetical protein